MMDIRRKGVSKMSETGKEKTKRAMTILYEVHGNLYINLTNKCPCACTFCLRQTRDHMEGSGSLWLEHDTSYEELVAEFTKTDMNPYREAVFCGFGEPTQALDVLLRGAAYIKEHYALPTRINTNGLGNLINGENIVPKMRGLIDTVSISLNTPNAEEYHRLVRSRFGEQSFDAMLDFARECVKEGMHVVMTTVDTTITQEEEEQCRRICEEIGAAYRIRPWED